MFVNFDLAGGKGKIRITDRYGFPPVHTGRRLAGLCASICSKLEFPFKKVWLISGAAMDHIPISYHGYQSVTLSAGSLDRALLSMHSSRDIFTNVDGNGLLKCFLLGYEIKNRFSGLLTTE